MSPYKLPFDLVVHIYRRPFMRCDNLEMELYVGQGILRNLFDEMRVDETTTSITLSFPERWCNIVEERSIYSRLQKYYPNLKSVFIKTQSVYIIQSTPAGCCGIVSSDAEAAYIKEHGHLLQESDSGRISFPVVNTMFDMSKLNVMNGL